MVSLLFSLFFLSLLIMLVVLERGAGVREPLPVERDGFPADAAGEAGVDLPVQVRRDGVLQLLGVSVPWRADNPGVRSRAGSAVAFLPVGGRDVLRCLSSYPAAVGCLISMLIVSFVPRTRFRGIAAAGIAVLFVAMVVAMRYAGRGASPYSMTYSEITRLLNRLSFSQNAFLPSLWLSKGVLSLARSEAEDGDLLPPRNPEQLAVSDDGDGGAEQEALLARVFAVAVRARRRGRLEGGTCWGPL